MKKTKTIKKTLWTLIAQLMLNIAIVGAVSYYNTSTLINDTTTLTRDKVPELRNYHDMSMMHEHLFATGYLLLSLDPSSANYVERGDNYRKGIQEYINTFKENFDSLNNSTSGESAGTALTQAKAHFDDYLAFVHDLATRRDIAADERLTMRSAFEQKYEELEKYLEPIQTEINKGFSEAESKANNHASLFSIVNLALVIGGLILGLLNAIWSIRKVNTQLGAVTDRLTAESSKLKTGSGEVSGASTTLSESATQQAAAIEETVSSMEEMSSMISQTAQNAERSQQESEDGVQKAEKGKQVITRLSSAMEEILESNTKLEGIVKLIDEIKDKTKVINDIVFETRLLAFNASIEAARAGAHGKGFAVVADEVGKLAAMSGKAADEIRTLLESSTSEVSTVVRSTQERVQVGKEVSQEAESAFGEMSEVLHHITDSIKSIAAATQQQSIGVKQTNKAMSELDQVTQKNTRNADMLSGQASSLTESTNAVAGCIDDLKDLIYGSHDQPSKLPLDKHHQHQDKIAALVARNTKSESGPVPLRAEGLSDNLVPMPSLDPTPIVDKPTGVARGDSRWKRAA